MAIGSRKYYVPLQSKKRLRHTMIKDILKVIVQTGLLNVKVDFKEIGSYIFQYFSCIYWKQNT